MPPSSRATVATQASRCGRAVRSGRTLHSCAGDAYAIVDGEEKHVATLLSTVMTIVGRGLVD